MPPPGASRRHLATEPPSSRRTASSPPLPRATSSPSWTSSPHRRAPSPRDYGPLRARVCTTTGLVSPSVDPPPPSRGSVAVAELTRARAHRIRPRPWARSRTLAALPRSSPAAFPSCWPLPRRALARAVVPVAGRCASPWARPRAQHHPRLLAAP